MSEAGDEDYFTKALLDYEAEYEVAFTLHHCWRVLRKYLKWMDSEVPNFEAKKIYTKRYKSSRFSSFNPDFRDASINLNVDGGDDEEDEAGS
ncbi:hypothetical protein Tco_0805603 [Tanacetum coccineum]